MAITLNLFSLNHNYLQNPSSKPPRPQSLPRKIISNERENSIPANKIKIPIAPWMREQKGPFILPPEDKPRKTKKTRKPDTSLTEKVSGARGKRAMNEILRGIGKLQETHDSEEDPVGELGVKVEMGKLREALDSGEYPVGEVRVKLGMPWEMEEEEEERVVVVVNEREATEAEMRLDGGVLERLRGQAKKMRKWIKVRKVGVSDDVVDQVRIEWRDNELAMLKFDVPLSRNMNRACEIVEMKIGGLVVWKWRDTLVVYRGCSYQPRSKPFSEMHPNLADSSLSHEKIIMENDSVIGSLYEREADRLLEGLGPRFIDWWMKKPLPVDGDLLPEVVPGFKTPFRRCPPYARAKLTDYELTHLRKLAQHLPTHFVLGRNRKLQGLAAAILKLWEKCHIAKIAVKWGVQNTNNEEMANELKNLTGGVLLLRNKFLIIIYRGNDFIPRGVANIVVERELELREYQVEEEAARLKAIDLLNFEDESCISSNISGTLSEYMKLQSERAHLNSEDREAKVQLEAEKERLRKQLRNQERKLYILRVKIERSSKELAKINSSWRPAENDPDKEMMTEEERVCFRKIGLRMDSTLLLGRRGIFDGVVEGLHQHWKHREIVKVITMQRLLSQVVYTAKLLEAETGAILVSVDKLKEGHAIILYRGKNHKRPLKLVRGNLLNKREALSRSLEMQRIGSLKFFAHQRQKAISELKYKLANLERSTRN